MTVYCVYVMSDVDECESSPCLNAAECENSHASYTCVCPRSYSGHSHLLTLVLVLVSK